MPKQNCLIVAGDLQGFTAFSKEDTAVVDDFCKAYYQLLNTHLHTSAFRRKYLGDGFLFLYEFSQVRGNLVREIIASCIMLQEAYGRERSSLLLSEPRHLPQVLGIGITMGNVFLFQDPDGRDDFASAYINLATRVVQEAKASTVASHILIDESVRVLPEFQDWIDRDNSPIEYDKPGFGKRTAVTIHPEVARRVYEESVMRVAIQEARRDFFENVVRRHSIPRVLSLEFDRDDRSLLTLEFHPEVYRGVIDRGQPLELMLYAIKETSVEKLGPSLRVVTDQPTRLSQVVPDRNDPSFRPAVLAVALQSPRGLNLQLPEFRAGSAASEQALRDWFNGVRDVAQRVRNAESGMVVLYSRF